MRKQPARRKGTTISHKSGIRPFGARRSVTPGQGAVLLGILGGGALVIFTGVGGLPLLFVVLVILIAVIAWLRH